MKQNKKRIIMISMLAVVLMVVGITLFAVLSDRGEKTTKKEPVKEVIIDTPEKKKPQQEPPQEEEPIQPEATTQPETPTQPEVPAQPEAPKIEAIPGQHRDPNKIVVVIDPGHQLRGDSVKEPNGPGSTVMKARVTSGATGRFTEVAEYILNLQIGLKLRTELQNRGYTVYMTRETHDVNISNMERAKYATSVGADIAVRIHANGASSSSVNGAETMTPTANNPYISHLANASYRLGKCILDAYCQATGFAKRGVMGYDNMTGMNWSEVPVTIIEMGFMSNESDDRAMQDAAMQNNMVQGIANGIDAYFGL